MVKMMGIVLFLFYIQFKTCLSEIIAKNKGYCVVNYTEKVTVEESYVHTYTEPQLQLCSHGYRYYNCMRDVTKSERRKRKLLKDVPRTRVDCCAGYNNVTVHKNVYHCEPICDPPCIQGHCTAPGICTCPQGYEHQDSHECVPSCRPECKNSRCTAPGHCECDSGYDRINSSYCMPHCSKKCINGICHKPDECLCNEGYAKSSQFHCNPICDKPCVHSNCTGYNECTCWNNYRKLPSQSNVCSPICDFECLHGHCTAPNVCACNRGYNMKVGSVNICEPECNNCTNGFCIAPNNCTCNQNYSRNEDGQCEPICHDCSNGKCILPYECECFEGFDKNKDGKCVPFCNGCEYGNCTEPNVCTCFDGYERFANGECFPACNGGCFAGECVAPNNCSCQEYDRVEDNVCFPLQSNMTNNTSENIVLQRFQFKFFNSSSKIDFSSVYVKVKCSFNKEIENNSSCAINNSSAFSIDCSTIKKKKNEFKLLCIWNEFTSEIRDFYEENLSSVAYTENENSTFLKDEILDMTILLPAKIMAEDESCFMCPCDKGISSLVPGTFNILFSPCHRNSLNSSGLQRDLLHFSVLAALVAMAAIATVAFVVVYFARKIRHDYIVHSSDEQMDEISLPLNPDEP